MNREHMHRRWRTVVVLAAVSLAAGPSAATTDPLTTEQTPPAAAKKTPRCVGWAVGGAVVGLAAGYGVVAAGYAVAGQPIGDSAGDVALILTGEVLGMTFMPILTCQLSNEPYTVPAATFLIGGGLVGGTVVGAPLMLVFLSRGGLISRNAQAGDAAFMGDILLYLLATTGGVIAGGWAGLRLERWLRRDRLPQVFVAPSDGALTLGLRLDF